MPRKKVAKTAVHTQTKPVIPRTDRKLLRAWINNAGTKEERQQRKSTVHGLMYNTGVADFVNSVKGTVHDLKLVEDTAEGSKDTPLHWKRIFGEPKKYEEDGAPLYSAVHPSNTNTNPKTLMGREKVPMFSVVPPTSLIAQATAMRYGAYLSPRADGKNGYGPYNWRDQPVEAHIYIDAAMRHLSQWWDGEDHETIYDEQTGDYVDQVSHLAFALATIGIIIDADANGTLINDRPRNRSQAASTMLSQHKLRPRAGMKAK